MGVLNSLTLLFMVEATVFGLLSFSQGTSIEPTGCVSNCHGERTCTMGCDLWKSSINSSCEYACKAYSKGVIQRNYSDTVNCRQGCDYAVNEWIREIEGNISKPRVVELNMTSATFEIDTIPIEAFPFRMQYAEVAENSSILTWRLLSEVVVASNYVQVFGLHPFTIYKVRIVWIPNNHTMVKSTESSVFRTLPGGEMKATNFTDVAEYIHRQHRKLTLLLNQSFLALWLSGPSAPSTPPRITRAEAVSPHVIHLAWEPPTRSNGEIIYFNTLITDVLSASKTPISSDVPANAENTKIFITLRPSWTYSVAVAAFNADGMGPYAIINVTTPVARQNPNPAVDSPDTVLIYGTESELRLYDRHHLWHDQPTVFPFDSSVLENLPPPTTETVFHDFVMDIQRNLCFVAYGRGGIMVVDFEQQSNWTIYENLMEYKYRITKMTYDWINHHIYFVRYMDIYRCVVADLSIPAECVSIGHAHLEIRKMVADPVNGYLFVLLSHLRYDGARFFRRPLPKGDFQYHPDILAASEAILDFHFSLATFDIIYETCTIVFPERENGFMRSFACDGSDTGIGQQLQKDFREGKVANQLQFGRLNDLHFSGGIFFGWMFDDGDFFFLNEDYSNRTGKFNHHLHGAWRRYPANYVIGTKVYSGESQPEPYPVNPPSDIQIFINGCHVSIFWDYPRRLRWQSNRAYSSWTYSWELGEIGNGITNETFVVFNNLEANKAYSFAVRALGRTSDGPWSTKIILRTYSLHDCGPQIIGTNSSLLIDLHLAGPNAFQVLKNASGVAYVSDVIWAPNFVALYDRQRGNLNAVPTSVDVQSLPSPRALSEAHSLCYDWVGQKFYFIRDSAIFRFAVGGPEEEMFAISGLKQIVLDPLRGKIFWRTESIVTAAKMDGQNQQVILQLDTLLDDRVRGIAIDYKRRKLYLFVQRLNGTEVILRSLGSTYEELTVESVFIRTEEFSENVVAISDERLVALGMNNQLAIVDLQFPNSTLLYRHMFKAFVVVPDVKEELRELNRTFFDFQVIPSVINGTNIKLEENGDGLILSWPAVTNCNWGAVLYDVSVKEGQREIYSKKLINNSAVIRDTSFAARLEVSIRPLTEWATANVTIRTFDPVVVPTGRTDTTIVSIFAVLVAIFCFAFTVGMVHFGRNWFCCRKIKRLTSRVASPDPEALRWEIGSLSDNAAYELGNIDLSRLPHMERAKITLLHVLGKGVFGQVWLGTASNVPGQSGTVPVAVKELIGKMDRSKRIEFLKEANSMNKIKHKNVLRFHGVCIDEEPFYLIMEYMADGDLLRYLRETRPENGHRRQGAELRDALDICLDIARGCAHLEHCKFIHRDLAARNCLVTHENERRIVKIGDFGLAREVYGKDYYRLGEKRGLLPVRWMAPESITDCVFNTKSDVWAFGIVVWEVMTYGITPYETYSIDRVPELVKNGRHPLNTDEQMDFPRQIEHLLTCCWKYEWRERPSFRTCLEAIEHMLRECSDGSNDEENFAPTKEEPSSSPPVLPRKERARYVGQASSESGRRLCPGSPDSGVAVLTPKYPTNANKEGRYNSVNPSAPFALEDAQGYVAVNPNVQMVPYLDVAYADIAHSTGANESFGVPDLYSRYSADYASSGSYGDKDYVSGIPSFLADNRYYMNPRPVPRNHCESPVHI